MMMLNRFIQRAPENFLSREQIHEVRAGRRGFLAGAFAAAAGTLAAAGRCARRCAGAEGEPKS
jgi:sulfane dehydrogenase subunit SoxC